MDGDLRGVLTCSPAQMDDWKAIAKAFADEQKAELLFVNEQSFGIQLPNGSFSHIYIDELKDYLEARNKAKKG